MRATDTNAQTTKPKSVRQRAWARIRGTGLARIYLGTFTLLGCWLLALLVWPVLLQPAFAAPASGGWADVVMALVWFALVAGAWVLVTWSLLWAGWRVHSEGVAPSLEHTWSQLKDILFTGGLIARLVARIMSWTAVGALAAAATMVTVAIVAYSDPASFEDFSGVADLLARGVAPAIFSLVAMVLLVTVPSLVVLYNHGFLPYVALDPTMQSAPEVMNRARSIASSRKWELIRLDVSFAGWWLLVFITLGLALPLVSVYWATSRATLWSDMLEAGPPWSAQ